MDYTSDGAVRFPLMVTEEEAKALHALAAGAQPKPAVEPAAE